MNKDNKKNTWGGSRKGAGRPCSDTRPISIRIGNDAYLKLQNVSEQTNCTKSHILEQLIIDNLL